MLGPLERRPEASVALWLVVWLPLLGLDMPPAPARMLYVTAVMASLWMHKPIPLVVTSLLPLILLPALGVRPAKAVASAYMSDANMLFLGGFMVAAAVERCGLHRRLATSILLRTAGEPRLLLLGFMLATALLSAFMSNTATAAMQVPLAEGVIRRMQSARRRAVAPLSLGAWRAPDGRGGSPRRPERGASGGALFVRGTAEADCEARGTMPLRVTCAADSCDFASEHAPHRGDALAHDDAADGDARANGARGAQTAAVEMAEHKPFSSRLAPAAVSRVAPHGAGPACAWGGAPVHAVATPSPGAPASDGCAGAGAGADEEDGEIAGFAKSLLLGIAYSSSLGGISTLTGTGPNLVLVGQLSAIFPAAPQLSFVLWAAYALPIVLCLLLTTWLLLLAVEWRRRRRSCAAGRAPAARLAVDGASLRAEQRALGALTSAERSTLCVLVATLIAWVTRHPVVCPGWDALFRPGYVSDTTVVAMSTVLLFVLPGGDGPPGRAQTAERGGQPADGGAAPLGARAQLASPQHAPRRRSPPAHQPRPLQAETSATRRLARPKQPPPRLLDWETARLIPWDVVLLLGGGFALADGFGASGLSRLLACRLLGSPLVSTVSLPALLLLVCATVTAVTEVCSNVATSTIVLPILATLAQALRIDPRLLMVPATISTSLAFMLPVSTPPNAIAFATGRLEVRDMLAPGLALNVAGALVIVCGTLLYGRAVLGISLDAPPAWAVPSGAAMAGGTCDGPGGV
ncbi:hypothetical protein KFE25_003485 [Diacronema lutheri]|uniref:Citrate transporter-like domain-containing protein n=1 Tax=Diacronema lutheri TaxID=2081491 RepID=A0A8J6C7E3_DIALT|nr:hypothetical protein KFE25_003485 [Diacronema lutheri]